MSRRRRANRHRWSRPTLALLLLFCALQLLSPATAAADGPTDEDRSDEAAVNQALLSDDDIDKLSLYELREHKTQLNQKINSARTKITSLEAETSTMREKRKKMQLEVEGLAGAERWEEAEKLKREEALAKVERETERKQDEMGKMEVHVHELRKEVDLLTEKLAEVQQDKKIKERRYYEPTIVDLVEDNAKGWGSVPRTVVDRTVHDVVPAAKRVKDRVFTYKKGTSPLTRRLVSIAVYAFLLGSVVLMRRVVIRIRGRLTVPRVLFLSDTFCACLWSFLSFTYLLIKKDPLVVTMKFNDTLFFVIQLAALVLYVAYVLLRVVVLAAKMTFPALGELLGVIIVGHHYYVYIWLPAVEEEAFQGNVFYYACYSWFFYALGMARISSFSDPDVVRTKGAPLWTPLGLWERAKQIVAITSTPRGSSSVEQVDEEGAPERQD